TPSFAQSLGHGSLGDAGDLTNAALQRPGNVAVWAAQCPQIEDAPEEPGRGVLTQIIGHSGVAQYDSLIADAVTFARCSAQGGQFRNLVPDLCAGYRGDPGGRGQQGIADFTH